MPHPRGPVAGTRHPPRLWLQYPPPTSGAIDELGALRLVFISHIHEDHCSPATLRRMDRDTRAARRRSPAQPGGQVPRAGRTHVLQRHAGASVHAHRVLHPGWWPTSSPPTPTTGSTTPSTRHWSSHWDGSVIYNANDCPPYAGGISYIRETYGQVDLALLPYASGSSYPACYDNLTHQEKLAERDRLRQRDREQSFIADVRALEPSRVDPSPTSTSWPAHEAISTSTCPTRRASLDAGCAGRCRTGRPWPVPQLRPELRLDQRADHAASALRRTHRRGPRRLRGRPVGHGPVRPRAGHAGPLGAAGAIGGRCPRATVDRTGAPEVVSRARLRARRRRGATALRDASRPPRDHRRRPPNRSPPRISPSAAPGRC